MEFSCLPTGWFLSFRSGWFIQPDCNIPYGESFTRQSLYSQRYYLEKLGLLCDTGYNVDSFGHSGMLPQILKLSGMSHYVFSGRQTRRSQVSRTYSTGKALMAVRFLPIKSRLAITTCSLKHWPKK